MKRVSLQEKAAGFGLAVLSLTSAACDDPLLSQQVIAETRVLAARSEVVGDDDRAWPRPGEETRVRWLVVGPGQVPATSWAFDVCPASPSYAGGSACQDSAFASFSQDAATRSEPSFTFALPDDVGGEAEVLVSGVICDGGTPVGTTSCAGAEKAIPVAFNIGIDEDPYHNQSPSFAAAELRLGDSSWQQPVASFSAGEPCSALPEAPEVTGSETLTVQLPTGLREELPDETRDGFEAGADRETLELTWYSTLGKLESAFAYVESNEGDPPAERSVVWTAPERRKEGGELVRFDFVMRDLRGGSDWTSRVLCLK